MKRFATAALALSMIAIPTLQSQAAPIHAVQSMGAAHSDLVQVGHRYDRHSESGQRGKVEHRKYNSRKKVTQHRHWKRGDRYSDWRRHQQVRDWHRHGLRRPGRGQEWIRVGNDYLLVSLASDIIAGLIAGR
ncbi:MAG: RcnB family protein [Rhizobiaceae bacterium]|nr:RcnB family protein [Rhizobiaceae bacterium]